ncbi:Retrotransposon-derived protein PEG10 [Clarias magur]|uniref:Retrotransposon-derived protein PEG10 n=1 Tax=Clarias magur TaxID=1594786 RepID=A0A8J4U9F7_CLAMG|nr:Retrotransposon-derived protein PEG10 [Clarias magur]
MDPWETLEAGRLGSVIYLEVRSIPDPMQVDQQFFSRLTPTERQRRLTQGLCLYCAEKGHVRLTCHGRPPRPKVWEFDLFHQELKVFVAMFVD